MAYSFAKRWLPPGLRDLINRIVGASLVYRGPYVSWVDAQLKATGYDADDILARVSRATSQVLDGTARYEQDGVAFLAPPPPSDALAGILLTAALHDGELRVLDFGGGLGSHFLRWREHLAPLRNVSWVVVEQAHYIREGERLLANIPSISFASAIPQNSVFAPNVVLASSVLQYLSSPLETLDTLLDLKAEIIVIDRTPLTHLEENLPMTQHVPRTLGSASYPLWALSRDRVYGALSENYRLLLESAGVDAPIIRGTIRAQHACSIWIRKG